jgi:transcriptional regulator with XRE-family HTH domain
MTTAFSESQNNVKRICSEIRNIPKLRTVLAALVRTRTNGRTRVVTANRVRDLRLIKRPKMSIDAIADASGVSRGKIHRIETHSQELLDSDAERLAEALGCSLVEILGIGVEALPLEQPGIDAIKFDPPEDHYLYGADGDHSRTPYKVTTDVLGSVGIRAGDIVIATHDDVAIADASTGDIVLLQIGNADCNSGHEPLQFALRVYLAPDIFVTQALRPEGNKSNIDSRTSVARIAGVIHTKLAPVGKNSKS